MSFGVEIPRILNEDLFEDLCLDLFRMNDEYENTNRNGRRGQRQDGVDIFARNKLSLKWLGIQCKVKDKGNIRVEEVDKEIERAYKFNPKITQYTFYTTAKRDSNIQAYIRSRSDDNVAKGLFNIDILFWEDIENLLRSERYNSIHYKYYREYYTRLKEDGFSFGKLISLNIGHQHLDSFYPLLIGKIYREKNQKQETINHWKGIYYIVNFNEYTSEIFPIPCYPSDLEAAFKYKRDRYIITKFINSIPNMDNFIESKESHFELILTDEEYKEFLDMYCKY